MAHTERIDGVLDRDDVLRVVGVDVVDHRRERRRLARAGGAGEQNQAALLVGDLVDDRGEQELRRGLDLKGNGAADDRNRAALNEGVDAEACDSGIEEEKSTSRSDRKLSSLFSSVSMWKSVRSVSFGRSCSESEIGSSLP